MEIRRSRYHQNVIKTKQKLNMPLESYLSKNSIQFFEDELRIAKKAIIQGTYNFPFNLTSQAISYQCKIKILMDNHCISWCS